MIRLFIFLITLLFGQSVYADLLNSRYVSPENYAVNEADLIIDYSHIPPAPKFDIDRLNDNQYQQTYTIEQETTQNNYNEEVYNETQAVENKSKKPEKQYNEEAYKKRLSYKFAKWWVDQRYKREEPHHGDLHEIKIQKRIDYEKKLDEQRNKEQ